MQACLILKFLFILQHHTSLEKLVVIISILQLGKSSLQNKVYKEAKQELSLSTNRGTNGYIIPNSSFIRVI